MPSSSYRDWDEVYRTHPAETLPWELGKPRKTLVDLIRNGRIQPGSTLDLCCGLGTNTTYMAQKGFDVTAIDISKHALKLAKQKARKTRAEIKFVLASFVTLPFRDTAFDFVFDMGCFHHVEPEDRSEFIQGVRRVLKPESKYLLVCFSDRNGPAWNHFTKEQIARHFSGKFKLLDIEHFGSVEGDGYTRFFYSVLMQPRQSNTCNLKKLGIIMVSKPELITSKQPQPCRTAFFKPRDHPLRNCKRKCIAHGTEKKHSQLPKVRFHI